MNAQKRRDRRRLPTAVLALIVLGLVLGSLTAGILKPKITSAIRELTGSPTRVAYFAANQFVLEDTTAVKLAGIDVGVVDSVEQLPDGQGAKVTMIVNDDVVSAAGTMPSAQWRPNTLLGGKMNITLVPGGDRTADWVDPIPVERTRLPVEFDDIVQTFQPDALEGSKAAVQKFDATLGQGGTEALKQLLRDSPDTFRPAAGALEAFRGTRPEADLPQFVANLQKTSSVLTRKDGQLDAVIARLEDTAAVLSDTAPAFAQTIDKLPTALDHADHGLKRLNHSLDKLEDAADPTREIVEELDDLLARLEPTLREAHPVLHDLREGLDDLRPVVNDLPSAFQTLGTFADDVHGPVLDRLNGPVLDVAYAPYHGEGPYQNTSSDVTFDKEVGYMFSNLAGTGGYVDPNGHAVAFQPGPGTGSVSGAGDFSLEQMYQGFFQGQGGH